MRSLASIKIISDIIPIEGKDRIAVAIVDGWSVIINKSDYKIGDKCVYCEIDSVMPETPEFEFLRSKNFRIKTMKMAGVVSQGICFPLSILPKNILPTNSIVKNNMITTNEDYNVGDDVSNILGIKQYQKTMDIEPDIKNHNYKYPNWLLKIKLFRSLFLKGKDKRAFPDFISKTDETRIQNMPFILKCKEPFVVTEKIDGQSGTFCLVRKKTLIPFLKDKFEYIVCSRNLRLFNKDNSSYWKVSDKYNIKEKLKLLIGNHKWVAIQGECIAPNVQGNKYKVSEADLYVFNLIYPTGRVSSLEMAEKMHNLNLKFVPIINKSYVLPDTVKEILDYSHGTSSLHNTLREGLVFRSLDGKQSFKAVDPLFLLQHDE